jgi:hypothetical protein
MENDLSKLFYDVCPSHNTFVLNWLYSAEQEKSSALTIELEKMQAALDKDLD